MSTYPKSPLRLSGDIWQRWEEKHKELTAKGQWQLAGLFQGHEHHDFRTFDKRILYTGKATRGEFNLTNLDHDYFGCSSSGFWSFARRLSGLTGADPEQLQNVAWSNLCKIGVGSGNPSQKLVDEQASLAIETLQKEWRELKPSLVVCVAEGYQEGLVYRAFGLEPNDDDTFEVIDSAGLSFYTRPSRDDMPAFLWMKHPERKPREYLIAAESIARKMLEA